MRRASGLGLKKFSLLEIAIFPSVVGTRNVARFGTLPPHSKVSPSKKRKKKHIFTCHESVLSQFSSCYMKEIKTNMGH